MLRLTKDVVKHLITDVFTYVHSFTCSVDQDR